MMRRILVDHARGHARFKRGGHQIRVPLEGAIAFSENDGGLLALDDALSGLEKIDWRQSRIVELRFFGGLTADVLGISPKTVKRDWSVARAWLHAEVAKLA
jgi:RNA polymerase sigma factor (TIGR02999 family)